MSTLVHIVFVLLLLGFQYPDSYYLEQGLKAEQEGNYKKALTIWLDGKVKLSQPSHEIGREYIRLVTEQELDSHYQSASAMYFWGLSASQIEGNEKVLLEELDFLKPLLKQNRYKEWQKLIKENNPILFQKIRLWWSMLDPTPATSYNERIIEHWERIAFARKNYVNKKENVFGTDERGPIYIRYGKPDRVYTGFLKITHQEAQRTAGQFGAGTDANQRSIANAVMSLHKEPYYEIWVYLYDKVGSKENIVMIFGETDVRGFSRAFTVEDFIPNRGFTLSDRYEHVSLQRKLQSAPQQKSRISPSMVMQWLYYKQLATKDFYFANLFSRMEFEWKSGYFDRYIGPQTKQRHFHNTLLKIRKDPRNASSYEFDFPSIPLNIYQYRMLDERNRPVFATILQSRPQQTFLEDLSFNQDSMFSGNPSFEDTLAVQDVFQHYQLVHGVQLKDSEGQLLNQDRLYPTLVLDGNNMQTASSSAFIVPYVPNESRQVFYAELHNRHPKTKPAIESPFPGYLRGLGKTVVEQPEPLDNTPSRLQVSDLVLGYQITERDSSDSLFPFVISPEGRIPAGESLALHFEVYHLTPKPDGLTSFQVDYQILPLNFLGWTKRQKDEFTVSLQYEHDQSRFLQDLEIKASKLKPGRYKLQMEVTDRVSGQNIEREIQFEVIE